MEGKKSNVPSRPYSQGIQCNLLLDKEFIPPTDIVTTRVK